MAVVATGQPHAVRKRYRPTGKLKWKSDCEIQWTTPDTSIDMDAARGGAPVRYCIRSTHENNSSRCAGHLDGSYCHCISERITCLPDWFVLVVGSKRSPRHVGGLASFSGGVLVYGGRYRCWRRCPRYLARKPVWMALGHPVPMVQSGMSAGSSHNSFLGPAD